jgi:hypothetical protein
MSNYKCIKKFGPYDGPYQKDLISYFFKNKNETIVWHTCINKDPKFEINASYCGLYTRKFKNKNIINYQKSKPLKLQLQLL